MMMILIICVCVCVLSDWSPPDDPDQALPVEGRRGPSDDNDDDNDDS